jgi:hypothetical protein
VEEAQSHFLRVHVWRQILATWRNRIVGHGEEAPDQLLANPRNWRLHPKGQQDVMAQALDEVGWVTGVIVNRRTGFVVDGHLRVSLAIGRGETSIPVQYVDLDEREEGIVLASLDPISAMAGRDGSLLAELVAGLEVDDGPLAALLAVTMVPEGDTTSRSVNPSVSNPSREFVVYVDPTQYEDVMQRLKALGERMGTRTISDTVLGMIYATAVEN